MPAATSTEANILLNTKPSFNPQAPIITANITLVSRIAATGAIAIRDMAQSAIAKAATDKITASKLLRQCWRVNCNIVA